MHDVWTYRDKSELGSNLVETHADISGFSVEALDGSIGKVDEATYDVGSSYVVVDTGPWIFGKKVMLPAGVVRGIDETDETVFVNRTKDEIKNAPEFDFVADHGFDVSDRPRLLLRAGRPGAPRLGRRGLGRHESAPGGRAPRHRSTSGKLRQCVPAPARSTSTGVFDTSRTG